MEGEEPDRAAAQQASGLTDDADRAAPQRAAELAEFRGRLAALTPRIVVTPVLLGANVLVFAIMVARGVSPLSPTTEDLLAWGANYAPLSADGQWWRLATAMFLHVGLVHLLMNMWVLWDAGRMVERMLGPVAFAAAYLLAGLAGSCASALWSPDRPSAGASGAIFGIFGLLGAFLLKQRRAVPPAALGSLTRTSIFFVGFNVFYGLTKPNIDMAAHLGGLAGGFAAGLPLVHALTPEARAGAWRRAALVTAVGLAAMAGLWSRAPRLLERRAAASLARFELPGASIELPAGAERGDPLDYANGRIHGHAPGQGEVLLSWTTLEMMTEPEVRRTVIDPLVQSAGPMTIEEADVTVAGNRGFRYLARDAHGRVAFEVSVWPCGKRVFFLNGTGAASTLARPVRESFACRPDPAQDGKERPIGVELDAGSEFGLIDLPDVLSAMSLDGEVILVALFPAGAMSDETRNEAVPRFLVPVVGTFLEGATPSFGPMTRERGPRGERAVWRGQARKDGAPLRLLAVEIDCARDQYMGIYYGSAALPEKRGLGPLLAARCSATPTRPRRITELAQAACARGDKRGCTLLQ